MWSISSDTGMAQASSGAVPQRMPGRPPDRIRAALAMVVVVLIASAGCDGNDMAPSDAFAGRWSGIADDIESGRGTLQITLSDDVTVSGTWSLTIGSGGSAGSIVAVPTVVRGPDRQFTMTCGVPPAGGAVLLTASIDGGALQGTYVSFACPRLSRGSIRLARR